MPTKFYPLSFLFAFIFSIAFWGYVNLNSRYTTFVEMGLNVKVANGRAIEGVLPESLFLQVRGTGYDLVKLLYFSQRPECFIDVSPRPLESSRERYVITQDSLKRGITTPLAVDILSISPSTLSFRTDVESFKRIPVEPVFDMQYRRGFTLISAPAFRPDSITIRGTSRIIQSIASWRTSPLALADVHEPFEFTIPLKDSLSSTVERSDSIVRVTANVQQVAELTFQDIPVEVQSAPPGADHAIRPQIVTVTVRGGIRQLQYMTPSVLRASVPYYELTQDSTGFVRPVISLPAGLQLVKVTPQFLRHTVTRKITANELITSPARLNSSRTDE